MDGGVDDDHIGWIKRPKRGEGGLLPLPSGVCVCVCVVHLTLIRWINRNRWIVNNLPVFIYRGPARSQCIQRICRLFRVGGAHLFRYRHTGPAGSWLLSGTDRVERDRERERGRVYPPHFLVCRRGWWATLKSHHMRVIYRREFCSNAPFDGKAHGPASYSPSVFFYFPSHWFRTLPPRFNPPTFNNARLLRTSAELFNSYARRYINAVQRIKLISPRPFPNWLLKLPLIVNASCIGCFEPLTCPADYSFPLDVPNEFQHFCLSDWRLHLFDRPTVFQSFYFDSPQPK
jgi:hypothetical protein